MPIANDVSTGEDQSVDKQILKAARDRVPTGLLDRNTPTSSSAIGPQRSNFVPSAAITGGRVRDLGSSMTPALQSLARTFAPEYRSEETSSPSAFRLTAASDDRKRKALQAAEEVGMMAGATTTLPEIEQKSTGVPAWDNRLEEALAPGATQPDRSRGSTTYRDREAAAEQQIAEMARQKQVEDRTGRKAMGSRPGGKEVLDVLEYRDLSPDQKAAVDFNTLLSKTSGRDKRISKGDAKPTPEYNSAARQVVGDVVGPIKFAPETINLLGSIGVETGDVSLDDFLKLKIAVNADDLRGFSLEDKGGPDASLNTPERRRTLLQREVVEAFRNTQRDQAAGPSLLEVQRDLLGTNSKLGFGTANMDADAPMDQQLTAYFQNSLYDMARVDSPEEKTKAIMAEAKELLTDEEFQSFINFLDVRTREAMQYRRPLGEGVLDPSTGEPLEFRLARDFRKQIGF